MDFKSSYRMEAVYFQKLKSDIDIVKSLMNDGNTEEARALLENAVDVDGAVLLLYRNLGDVWGELGAQIQKTNDALKELKETTDKYHEELNEKIDDVNNTIIRLLNALEDRVAAVEHDLATMSRVKILSLVNENGTYHIYDGETEIDFDALSEMVEFPHDVIIRGVVNGEDTVFQLREIDTDETSGSFEFYSPGLDNNVVSETTVTVLPDDSVNVATETQTMKEYSAGNGIIIDSNDEISVDFDVAQEKLIAGSGIAIDPNTNKITNTAQGKIYTAGTGINITSSDNIINSVNDIGFLDRVEAGNTFQIDTIGDIYNQYYLFTNTAYPTHTYARFTQDPISFNAGDSGSELRDLLDNKVNKGVVKISYGVYIGSDKASALSSGIKKRFDFYYPWYYDGNEIKCIFRDTIGNNYDFNGIMFVFNKYNSNQAVGRHRILIIRTDQNMPILPASALTNAEYQLLLRNMLGDRLTCTLALYK